MAGSCSRGSAGRSAESRREAVSEAAEGAVGSAAGTSRPTPAVERARLCGEPPCASARMRCFIVGGRARSAGQSPLRAACRGITAVAFAPAVARTPARVASAVAAARSAAASVRPPWPSRRPPLRAGPLCGTAAADVVETSPSAVNSARNADTSTCHIFLTWVPVMDDLTFGWGDLRTFLMMCMRLPMWGTFARGASMVG